MVKGHTVKSSTKKASVTSKPASASPAVVKQVKQASSKKKSADQSADQIPGCSGCGTLISDDTRALLCDKCQLPEAWKCASCLNLPADVYDSLVSIGCTSLIYLCDQCDCSAMKDLGSVSASDKLEEMSTLLQKLTEKIDNIESGLKDKVDLKAVEKLDKRMQSLEHELSASAAVMQNLQKDEDQYGSLNNKVEEVVTLLTDRHCDCRAKDTNDVVHTLQEKLLEDEMEKEEQEKRKTSVIVFGLSEPSSDDAAVRVVEDVENFQSVMSELKVQHQNDITKVVRLGKRPESAEAKPRPLKVSFSSEEAKSALLKTAKNLKDMKEGGWDSIFIYPDLTPKQRDARKKLVTELKIRQSNGETGLMIIGSKIIKKRY